MTVRLSDTPVLETANLILRAPQAGDWPVYADFIATERSQYMGGPLTRDKAWRSMGHLIGHWVLRGWGLFVICGKTSNAPLGAAGTHYPEGWTEPELGWSIWEPSAEGKGIAFEAATAARAHAYNTLGWTTAISYIDPDNARSIALAKRLGAVHEPGARLPDLDGWEGTLVFRHPAPEAVK